MYSIGISYTFFFFLSSCILFNNSIILFISYLCETIWTFFLVLTSFIGGFDIVDLIEVEGSCVKDVSGAGFTGTVAGFTGAGAGFMGADAGFTGAACLESADAGNPIKGTTPPVLAPCFGEFFAEACVDCGKSNVYVKNGCIGFTIAPGHNGG